MSRNDRWERAAEAFVELRWDDALTEITVPCFGDLPPLSIIEKACENQRHKINLWRRKMEMRWLPWIMDQKLDELDKFRLNFWISTEYGINYVPKSEQKRKRAKRLRART